MCGRVELAMLGGMTSCAAVALRCDQVTKTFGVGPTAVCALAGIDVSIPTGSFTAIVGPSGSGKSTLLHVLAGLDTVSSGTVALGGTTITGLSDAALTKLRRTQCGFVFQHFNLVDVLTVQENIELPFNVAGKTVNTALVQRVTQDLGIADRLHHLPSELSGGQAQRTAIARALVMQPHVIFADEPTGALDQASGAQVLTALRRAVDEHGHTVMMVTHDPSAAACADQVVVLRDGLIEETLTTPSAQDVADRLVTNPGQVR